MKVPCVLNLHRTLLERVEPPYLNVHTGMEGHAPSIPEWTLKVLLVLVPNSVLVRVLVPVW